MSTNIPKDLNKLLNDPFRVEWNEKNVNKLKETFGTPPFKFHTNDNINTANLPPKIKRKTKYFNTVQTPEQTRQRPGPNWYGLKDCEFVSSEGIEYKLAEESVQTEYLSPFGYKQGQAENTLKKMSSYWEMQEDQRRQEITTLKRAVLYIRGSRTRQLMRAPKDGTKLTLTLKKTRIDCTCTVDFTGVMRTAKSGYLIVSNLNVIGPTKLK